MDVEYRVTLKSPDGEEFDVADRIDLGEMGTMSESLEELPVELIHGDIAFHLDDADGAVEQFLDGATPDTLYEVIVERQVAGAESWERIFAGVLDLPWSLQYERKDARVAVQAFSYSKLLERSSAEAIRREPGELAGTTTAASPNLHLDTGATTLLAVGDTLTISNGEDSESKVIITIVDSNDLVMDSDYDTSFAEAPVTLDTPYHRMKSVAELAGLVFTEAGIDEYQVDIGTVGDDVTPFATPAAIAGLPTSGNTRHLMRRGGLHFEVMVSGGGTYRAADGVSAWALEDAGAVPKVDYSNQQDTEPTLVNADSGLGDRPSQFVSEGAYLEAYRAIDYATGDIYTMRCTLTTGPLVLLKNGSAAVTVEAAFGPDILQWVGHCYDRANARVVIWYGFGSGGPPHSARIKAWDGSTLTTLYTDDTGIQRGTPWTQFPVPGIDQRLGVVVYPYMDADGALHAGLIEGASLARSFDLPGAGSYLYTLRSIDRMLFFLYRRLNGSVSSADTIHEYRLRVVDFDTLETLADSLIETRVGAAATTQLFLTRSTLDGEDVLFGFIGRNPFIVARSYAGVIPYADFDGLSCAAAMRELAVASFALFTVGHDKVGVLKSRTLAATEDEPTELPTPLERETSPVWEGYRASVLVRSEDVAGEEIEELAGATGDSARRLEIEARLATTSSHAQQIAQVYASYFGTPRVAEMVRVPETGTILRPRDRVRYEDTTYQVVEAETALEAREQDLTLVEVA